MLWKQLYKDGAYKDAGTLAQLKSLINRTNVPKKPKVNVNAAEDFLNASKKSQFSMISFNLMCSYWCNSNYIIMLIFIQIVMEGHIIAATLKHFKMENCESDLPATLTCELQSSEGRSAFHKHILNMLIGLINPIRPGKETGDHGSCADGVFTRGGEIGGGRGGFSPPTLETRGAEPPHFIICPYYKLQQHSSVIILGVCKEC